MLLLPFPFITWEFLSETLYHYSLIFLLHKLIKFLYNCLEKSPIRFEKALILTNHVHNIRCNYSFVLLIFSQIDQIQKCLRYDWRNRNITLIVLIKNYLSFDSFRIPEIDPIHQHKLLRLSNDHSLPSN